MSRRVCLSIGVGNVTPRPGEDTRFAYLDGAPVAAMAIGEWALSSGFGADNVKVLTDAAGPGGAPNPVTSERLQGAVDALFGTDGPIAHLILSFCGHGLTADVGSTFWLFSDSLERQYRVNVDAFISELLTFGITRISLISDACRDAPKDLDLMRLDSRRAIVGRQRPSDSPMFDRLAACQDGQRAYMVVDQTSAAPGKCILSGVALDVLWGNEPDAFKSNVIDTHSFGNFTRTRARERAKGYGFKLDPQCLVDPQPVLLVDGAARPAPAIELQPWPPTSQGVFPAPLEHAGTRRAGADSFELLRSNSTFREEMLGKEFGTSHPHLDASAGFGGLPDDARPLVDRLHDLRERQRAEGAGVDAEISSMISVLEAKAATHARAAAAGALDASLAKLDVSTDANQLTLIVAGSPVRAVWSETQAARGYAAGGEARFHVELSAQHGAQVMVEFGDGAFVPVYLYPNLFAIVVRESSGHAAIAYASRYGGDKVLTASRKAIDELTRNVLDSSHIESMAARIRNGKHANPILGAVAGYLYRQISDFDNLRRMAYYYVHHQQPIPFDIALLGQMDVFAEEGVYFARVPAVSRRRDERRQQNPLPHYVTDDTPAVTGAVAGRCPWLTLGWDYPPGDLFGDRMYGEFGKDGLFRSSSFTSLPKPLGELLARAWNLRPQ